MCFIVSSTGRGLPGFSRSTHQLTGQADPWLAISGLCLDEVVVEGVHRLAKVERWNQNPRFTSCGFTNHFMTVP